MPVPWDDHQEQQQQWTTGSWSMEDNMSTTKDMAGEVTQALRGAQKIVSCIPDIGWLEIDFLLSIVTVLWYFSLLKEEII